MAKKPKVDHWAMQIQNAQDKIAELEAKLSEVSDPAKTDVELQAIADDIAAQVAKVERLKEMQARLAAAKKAK